MDLVEKIQSLCEQNNTTIAQLERDLDFSKGSIRKWDTSSPSSDKLLKVARHFDISMEALLSKENIEASIPYRLINKICFATTHNILKWIRFSDLDSEDYNDHPNVFDYFNLRKYKEFQDENYNFTHDDAFYATYDNGAYLIIKIINKQNSEYKYALFIMCNNNYFLYATDKNLPPLEDLFEMVKTKVLGVDDFINNFLNDDFNKNKDEDASDLPF
jgi:transcriptional regulator with XRE-family HTH domain